MSATVPALRVAINGFGRIGRYTAKLLLKNPEFNLVAINDLADPAAIAHLLKYDSVHGKFDAIIQLSPNFLQVNEHEVALFSESNPENLPWKKLNIDLVFECTGKTPDRWRKKSNYFCTLARASYTHGGSRGQ